MQATRKVIIADESREFAVPCASLLKSFGVEAVLVPKDGEALYEAIVAQKPQAVLCDVFMNKTLANLEKDAHVSVVVYEGLEGYQIKGTARWTDDADLVAAGNAKTSQFGLKTKGVVIVTPESAEVLTPGPEVGKSL